MAQVSTLQAYIDQRLELERQARGDSGLASVRAQVEAWARREWEAGFRDPEEASVQNPIPAVPPEDTAEPESQPARSAEGIAGRQRAATEGEGEGDRGERIIAAAREAGASGDEVSLIEAALGGGTVPTPEQFYIYTNGEELDDEQAEIAIDAYNELAPDDPITTVDQLKVRGAAGRQEAFTAVATATAGQTSNVVRISVAPRNELGVTTGSPQYENLDIVRYDLAGAIAGQGGRSALNRILAVALSEGTVPPEVLTAAVRLSGTLDPDEGIDTGAGEGFFDLSPSEFGQAIDRGVERATGAKVRRAAGALHEQIKRHLRDYNGSAELALVAVEDKQLADAIANRGYATPEEAKRVKQLFLKAGIDPQTQRDLIATGVFDAGMFDAVTTGQAAGGAGDVTARLPDRAATKESYRNLYQAWFQSEPSDAALENFANTVDQAVIAEAQRISQNSGGGNPFKPSPVDQGGGVQTQRTIDTEARLTQGLRSLPQYQALFSDKPAGISEEEYVRQFRSAGAQFLGEEAPSEAIRAGQQSGTTRSTIGAIAGSREAHDSPTFRERIARASQIMQQFT